MKNQSYFIIKLEIYPFDIMVSINEADEVLFKRLIDYDIKKKELKDLKFNGAGRTVIFDTNQIVIRINSKKLNIHQSISHEVFHAVTFLMDRIGDVFDIDKNAESYAYLIGYITKQIYNRLK
jgi:hypothetical protein